MVEKDYLMAWSMCKGIGYVRMQEILNVYGSAKNAWNNWDEKLLLWPESLNLKIEKHIRTFPFSEYQEVLKRNDVGYVSAFDDIFPNNLKLVDPIPLGIYWRGNWGCLSNSLLAVVGTRKITDYGKLVTKQLVSGIVRSGLGVVSGIMYGVDEYAHKSTSDNNGINVGVWAGGIDTLLRSSRSVCANMIVHGNGLILSEYAMGVTPSAMTFPARNRIVAGLSVGILVIEGSEKSGTLITAGYGAQMSKPVFAVPGPITSVQSQATVGLIKQGAIPVASVDDILNELPIVKRNVVNKDIWSDLDDDEKLIINLLSEKDLSVDELSRNLDWSVGRVTSCLSILELKDLVVRVGTSWSIMSI